MKKFTRLAAVTLFFSMSANAEVSFKVFENVPFSNHIFESEPISFIERGIVFYVFPDGQFDFNTESSRGTVYYRNGRRNVNQTFGTPAQNFGNGIKIEHDQTGRIRRIGNVFINYDFNDRIKRIGSVYMSYNRFALVQVGGLRIIYNRFGQAINFVGSVKGRYNSFNNQGNHNDGTQHNGNNSFYGNGNNGFGQANNDQIYYRKNTDRENIDNETYEDDETKNSNNRQ